MGLGLTLNSGQSYLKTLNLIACAKTLFQISPHSQWPGVRTWAYLWGGTSQPTTQPTYQPQDKQNKPQKPRLVPISSDGLAYGPNLHPCSLLQLEGLRTRPGHVLTLSNDLISLKKWQIKHNIVRDPIQKRCTPCEWIDWKKIGEEVNLEEVT